MVDATTIAVIIVLAIVLLGLVMFIMICKQLNTESPSHAVRISQKQMRRQSRLLSSAFTKHHFTQFPETTPRNMKAPITEEPAEDGDDERDSIEGGSVGTYNRGSLGQESGLQRDREESFCKRGDDDLTQEHRKGEAKIPITTSGTGTGQNESDVTSQTGLVNTGGDVMTSRGGDSKNNFSMFVTVPSPTHQDQPTDLVRVDVDELPPIVSSKPDQPVYDYKKMELPFSERVDVHAPAPEEKRGTEHNS